MKVKFLSLITTSLLLATSVFASETASPLGDFKEKEEQAIVTNYEKNPKATEFIKSKNVPFGVWLDSAIWRKNKRTVNEDAEFTFSMKDDTGYALMINEDVGVPIEVLKELIIENLEDTCTDFSIVKEEDRIVNEIPVLFYEIEANIKGLHITYMIYVHCGEEETVQLWAYTATKHYPKLKVLMENFLNGLYRT